MNPIWNRLYDNAKDRRYAALFFSSLVGCFILFFAGVFICQILQGADFSPLELQRRVLELLPGVLIIIAAFRWRAIRRARARREKGFRREELSRDEICKARSKLVKRDRI